MTMRYEVSDVRRKLAKDITGFSAKAPRPEKTHVEKLTDQQQGIKVVQGDLVKFPHGDPWFKSSQKIFRVHTTKSRGLSQRVTLVDPDTGLLMKDTVLSSVLAKLKIVRPAKPVA